MKLFRLFAYAYNIHSFFNKKKKIFVVNIFALRGLTNNNKKKGKINQNNFTSNKMMIK